VKIWEWFAERTGAARVWEALFLRHVPAPGARAGWLYTLGSATLLVFTVQIVTGCLLAMNYVPSPDHAYDSIRYIEAKVYLGAFVRGLHHWGSSFMVVLATAHLLRTFFSGAFKYPREVTWISGVVLLVLTMAFSFTGYLLPWDQKAYWATAVGTNMAATAPFLGRAFQKLMLGGEQLGAATLSRFYAVHVLLLPGAILVTLGAHLFLVVWHGITAPPARET